MDILFISPSAHPHMGGVETHIREVSNCLLKKGYKVETITGDKIGYPKIKFIGLLFIWLWFLMNLKIVKKADIVHIHDVFIWYLPLRFLMPRKPVFVTFHGYETVFPPKSKAILIRKLSEKLSWGNICVGDYIKTWYETKPTYVTYGGVASNEIRNPNIEIRSKFPAKGGSASGGKIQNAKLKIVFIGRLDEDVGIGIYLPTLDELKRREVSYKIVFLGEGKLQDKASRYGKVRPPHYNDTYYYSTLSKSDFVFASSYLAILQAMAAKKPVFAVYENPLKYDYLTMAPFAKWIVIESSAETLVERLLYFLHHPKEEKELVEKAYQWVREQRWDKVVNMYLKLWGTYERQ